MSELVLPFGTRVWFAWACFFRVFFDGAFAARVWGAKEPKALPEPEKPVAALKAAPEPPSTTAALQLLALFQREGRFVDFLEQDIASFSDADVGAAARVVHDGCRKALRDHVEITPLRAEEEGSNVTLEPGYSAASIKLSGDVRGDGPHRGVLRHRGWRAEKMKLPVPVAGHDSSVLCPAEVEL